MRLFLSYLICVFFLFFACNPTVQKKEEDGELIAKAGEFKLYSSSIKDIVPIGVTGADSIDLIEKYIQNWIKEALVIQKAEENLNENQKDVEKQLNDYRNSLITYIYEKELVNQKLDTAVSDVEIEEYYKNNESEFELKDNIIKVIYVKVNKKAPSLEKLKKWYKVETPKDREQLTTYCYQFAENYYLEDESWLLFDDLLKEIPIQTYNKELFLQNNRFVEVSDSAYHYFLNIKGFKIRNTTSPLSFEKENIKNIILNKRKLKLIEQMQQDVYTDALNKNKIEIYINDKSKK